MARKPRDTSAKRNSIIDAAQAAFVDQGYEVTSMDHIAERASASKRTVYNHFPSKEELFDAVISRFLEESESLKEIPYDPESTLKAQLSKFIDAKLATITNPAWFGLSRVALAVLIRDTQLGQASLERYQSGDVALIKWIRAAKADGRIQTDNAKLSANLFWSMVGGALTWPQLLAGPMQPRKIETLRKEIIETFLARHEPPPEQHAVGA